MPPEGADRVSSLVSNLPWAFLTPGVYGFFCDLQINGP